MHKSKVLVLYTGGTFGMVPENIHENEGNLVPANLEDISQYMPALVKGGFFDSKGVSLDYETLSPVKDSSDFVPEDWERMAACIEENYNAYDGFIIIHGTDTMAYTASALSFMLHGLCKPIVITGAQLPISHPRTDAISNFTNAIFIAAYKSFNYLKIPEVIISFNDDLLRGNRSTKYSTNDLEGFESPNYPSLATLEERIEIISKNVLPEDSSPMIAKCKFDNRVIIVTLFPGFNAQNLKNLILNSDIKGIVFRSFGSGNYAADKELDKVLQLANEKEILLLNTTQCYQGTVYSGKYKAGASLAGNGVVNGKDLTLEASLTKMMWCLGNFSYMEAKEVLGKNMKGEMEA